MSAIALNLAVIMLLCLTGCGGGAAERVTSSTARAEVTNSTVEAEETIRVIDIVIISTNRVMVGTNAMSVSAATNMIARLRDTVDVIAVYGSIKEDVAGRENSSAIVEITRAGVPLVFVEKDGDYSLREHSAGGGVRTVKIGSAQFADLRRVWKSGRGDTKTSSGPVLETTVDWDSATGTYGLKRIDIGLFGERVWLVQEQSESSDQSGGIGIQFRKKW